MFKPNLINPKQISTILAFGPPLGLPLHFFFLPSLFTLSATARKSANAEHQSYHRVLTIESGLKGSNLSLAVGKMRVMIRRRMRAMSITRRVDLEGEQIGKEH